MNHREAAVADAQRNGLQPGGGWQHNSGDWLPWADMSLFCPDTTLKDVFLFTSFDLEICFVMGSQINTRIAESLVSLASLSCPDVLGLQSGLYCNPRDVQCLR